MALVDDVRNLAEQAQRGLGQGAQQVQDKLEELRRRRRFNELARQLGRAVYQGRRQGGADETEVARICAQMAAVEAELADAERRRAAGDPDHPPVLPGAERPPAADPPGGYTLDDL
jgi:hypothetical protein